MKPVLFVTLLSILLVSAFISCKIFERKSIEEDLDILQWYMGLVKEGLVTELDLRNKFPSADQPKSGEYEGCIVVSDDISKWIEEHKNAPEKLASLTFEMLEEKKKEMDACTAKMYKVTGIIPPEELATIEEVDREAAERKKRMGNAPPGKCPLDEEKEEL